MISKSLCASIVALVVLVPLVSLAADLPVAYEVDEKVLKTGAPAGTSLTFELHGDDGCTSALASSPILVEALTIERVKLFKAKGGPKPPKLAMLRTTLTGVTPPAGGAYLKVTGDGITAIGSACQAQAAGVANSGLTCISESGTDVVVEGCNFHVRNDSGTTGGAADGLGNLIVGHAENGYSATRTGSHNLIVGGHHEWTSYGGLLAGRRNTVSEKYGSVSGGSLNTASGYYGSVSAGWNNTASGHVGSVSGGSYNTASGGSASVSGGSYNTASGLVSSVSGGKDNAASAFLTSVSGGYGNTSNGFASSISGGRQNYASNLYSSVSGGRYNTASGKSSSVSGGGSSSPSFGNTASGDYGSVSGGSSNTASGYVSSVTGGVSNTADGYYSSVSGGWANTATGTVSSVSGGKSNSTAHLYGSVSGGTSRSTTNTDNWAAGTYSSVP